MKTYLRVSHIQSSRCSSDTRMLIVNNIIPKEDFELSVKHYELKEVKTRKKK